MPPNLRLLLLALVILMVGLIVAKLIQKAVSKLLTRVEFDRAVERGGIKKALERSTFEPPNRPRPLPDACDPHAGPRPRARASMFLGGFVG